MARFGRPLWDPRSFSGLTASLLSSPSLAFASFFSCVFLSLFAFLSLWFFWRLASSAFAFRVLSSSYFFSYAFSLLLCSLVGLSLLPPHLLASVYAPSHCTFCFLFFLFHLSFLNLSSLTSSTSSMFSLRPWSSLVLHSNALGSLYIQRYTLLVFVHLFFDPSEYFVENTTTEMQSISRCTPCSCNWSAR